MLLKRPLTGPEIDRPESEIIGIYRKKSDNRYFSNSMALHPLRFILEIYPGGQRDGNYKNEKSISCHPVFSSAM
jgi:hypothetical protein